MKIPKFLCTFAKAESDLGILQVQHRKSLGSYLVQFFFLHALRCEQWWL